MVRIVYCRIDTGDGRAHCGAILLVVPAVIELKDVVFHDEAEKFHYQGKGKAGIFSYDFRVVEFEPFFDGFESVVCVDVGIHRHSVTREQGDVREVDVESAQSSLEVEGTLDVRGELTDERLELLVKPSSEAMG